MSLRNNPARLARRIKLASNKCRFLGWDIGEDTFLFHALVYSGADTYEREPVDRADGFHLPTPAECMEDERRSPMRDLRLGPDRPLVLSAEALLLPRSRVGTVPWCERIRRRYLDPEGRQVTETNAETSMESRQPVGRPLSCAYPFALHVDEPTWIATTATWRAYRDGLSALALRLPHHPGPEAFLNAAEDLLAWRASIPKALRFWDEA